MPSRAMKVLGLTLAVAATAVQATAIDDATCFIKAEPLGCQPSALCAYQDANACLVSTPSQSQATCSVRPNYSKLPQQMHLAYAGVPTGTGMSISWTTFEDVPDSGVWVGTDENNLVFRSEVRVESFTYYSEGNYSLYQHHAKVLGLKPNTKYFYGVGSASKPELRSGMASFVTARTADDATPFDIAVYGDLGWGPLGNISTDWINANRANFSMIFHIGDIGYADDDFLDPPRVLEFRYEDVYNKWMNSMTPVMSQVPYMVCPGNHETECHSPAVQNDKFKREHLANYTAYNSRFRMPSPESNGTMNMWYSFEYGPIHFTSISSETDFPNSPMNDFLIEGPKSGNFGNQLGWLEADLQKAAANRQNVPWLIVGMHRPIYQLENTNANGTLKSDSVAIQAAFEKLFIKYKVDLVFAGHAHSYERDYPIADQKPVLDGVSADLKQYSNVKAPIYVVTGGAGNPEPNKLSGHNKTAWNILESAEYGITTIHVTRSALTLKYVTTTTNTTKILDEFTVIKS